MIYITGDIHGNPIEIREFCRKFNLTNEDIMIMLGDVGANFYQNSLDKDTKKILNAAGPVFFCIQGNHDIRPEHFDTYKTKEWNGGTVWYEDAYPNLLFAKDGDTYNIDGKKYLVLGGAYSPDKYYRFFRFLQDTFTSVTDDTLYNTLCELVNGRPVPEENKKKLDNYIEQFNDKELYWWPDEQISEDQMKEILEKIKNKEITADIVLSHTCPHKYMPTEMFLVHLNQEIVDRRSEKFLEEVEENIDYDAWYCGHFHTDKNIDKIHFLFHSVLNI